MAEQKKEGMATVETTNVGGVQVRKYKINDENDTLIKIKSEAEQQRDIEEYEKRQQELEYRKSLQEKEPVQPVELPPAKLAKKPAENTSTEQRIPGLSLC